MGPSSRHGYGGRRRGLHKPGVRDQRGSLGGGCVPSSANATEHQDRPPRQPPQARGCPLECRRAATRHSHMGLDQLRLAPSQQKCQIHQTGHGGLADPDGTRRGRDTQLERGVPTLVLPTTPAACVNSTPVTNPTQSPGTLPGRKVTGPAEVPCALQGRVQGATHSHTHRGPEASYTHRRFRDYQSHYSKKCWQNPM